MARALGAPLKAARLIAENLTERIVAAKYAPGEFLPSVDELVEEFSVSRPTIREALHLLENGGFIRLRRGPNGGSQVLVPDHAEVVRALDALFRYRNTTPSQVLEVRLLLEPAAARLAAIHATDEELAELPALIEAQRSPNALRDPYVYHEAKQLLHRRIAELSRNPVISTLSQSLSDLALQIAVDAKYTMEEREISIEEQVVIVDRLLERDADGAAAAFVTHLSRHRL